MLPNAAVATKVYWDKDGYSIGVRVDQKRKTLYFDLPNTIGLELSPEIGLNNVWMVRMRSRCAGEPFPIIRDEEWKLVDSRIVNVEISKLVDAMGEAIEIENPRPEIIIKSPASFRFSRLLVERLRNYPTQGIKDFSSLEAYYGYREMLRSIVGAASELGLSYSLEAYPKASKTLELPSMVLCFSNTIALECSVLLGTQGIDDVQTKIMAFCAGDPIDLFLDSTQKLTPAQTRENITALAFGKPLPHKAPNTKQIHTAVMPTTEENFTDIFDYIDSLPNPRPARWILDL